MSMHTLSESSRNTAHGVHETALLSSLPDGSYCNIPQHAYPRTASVGVL